MSDAAPDQSTDASRTPNAGGGAPFEIPDFLKRGDIALALGIIAILVILVKVFFLRVIFQSFQNGIKILRVPGPIRADDAGGISPVRP